MDIVLDGTDNFETRFLINSACVKHNIPWVYGGVVSTYGMCAVIIPGETACLHCLMGDVQSGGPTCDTVGVLNTAVNIVASLESTEAIKILAGRKDALLGKLVHVDPWHGEWRMIAVKKQDDCPVCGKRIFAPLEKGPEAVALCGKNSVQIPAMAIGLISFKETAARLAGSGEAVYNDYMLRFKTDGYEITLFPDGRAIIKGTDDITRARSVYSKYIGA
jgi:molybdopterin-synthase adenylyltransferase